MASGWPGTARSSRRRVAGSLAQVCALAEPVNRRQGVSPVEDFRARLVHAHDRAEVTWWGRAASWLGRVHPRAGSWLMVMVSEPSWRVEEARGAVPDGVPVDRVRDQVEVGDVVHRQRPERPDRGRRVEPQAVGRLPVSCSPWSSRRSAVRRLVGVVAPQAARAAAPARRRRTLRVGDLPRGSSIAPTSKKSRL